jgi:hypothetical protein
VSFGDWLACEYVQWQWLHFERTRRTQTHEYKLREPLYDFSFLPSSALRARYLDIYSSQKHLKLRYTKTQSTTHQQAVDRLKQLLSQAQSTKMNPVATFRALNQTPAGREPRTSLPVLQQHGVPLLSIFTASLSLFWGKQSSKMQANPNDALGDNEWLYQDLRQGIPRYRGQMLVRTYIP